MKGSNQLVRTKDDLNFFLDADSWAHGYRKRKRFTLFLLNLRYQRVLRYHEYFSNNNRKLLSAIYGFRQLVLGYILGFTVPINVFDAGLKLNHHGCIVVNTMCRIGKWCDIHNGVNIGDNGYYSETGEAVHCVPTIGDRVYIGPGAKIFGKITVGDDVVVGANAVVSIDVPATSLAVGNPTVVKHKTKRLLTISDIEVEDSFIKHYPEYAKYFRR